MKVKFLPQDVEYEIRQGQTVMDLAHEKGIPIRSACNGMPSCAECRVRVTDGDWNINPPSRKELGLIGTGYYIDQRRLSCQMLCFGDITVDTSEQLEKAAEGPVTKKFLTKVHKSSAAESHSLGGVLIEQEGQMMAELKKDVPEAPQPNTQASLSEKRGGGGGGRDRGGQRGGRDHHRGGGGGANRGRDQRGEGQGQAMQAHAGGGGGGGGGERGEGGGRRRRRRGGRNRGGGGGGGNRGGGGSGGGNSGGGAH